MLNPNMEVSKSESHVKTLKTYLKPLKSTFSDLAEMFRVGQFQDSEWVNQALNQDPKNLEIKLILKFCTSK